MNYDMPIEPRLMLTIWWSLIYILFFLRKCCILDKDFAKIIVIKLTSVIRIFFWIFSFNFANCEIVVTSCYVLDIFPLTDNKVFLFIFSIQFFNKPKANMLPIQAIHTAYLPIYARFMTARILPDQHILEAAGQLPTALVRYKKVSLDTEKHLQSVFNQI